MLDRNLNGKLCWKKAFTFEISLDVYVLKYKVAPNFPRFEFSESGNFGADRARISNIYQLV